MQIELRGQRELKRGPDIPTFVRTSQPGKDCLLQVVSRGEVREHDEQVLFAHTDKAAAFYAYVPGFVQPVLLLFILYDLAAG